VVFTEPGDVGLLEEQTELTEETARSNYASEGQTLPLRSGNGATPFSPLVFFDCVADLEIQRRQQSTCVVPLLTGLPGKDALPLSFLRLRANAPTRAVSLSSCFRQALSPDPPLCLPAGIFPGR